MNERRPLSQEVIGKPMPDTRLEALSELQPYFDSMWIKQGLPRAVPVLLPGYQSGNFRPVAAGMRYAAHVADYTNEQRYRWEYVFGLFEQTPQAAFSPIGYMVLYEDAKSTLSCHGKSRFSESLHSDPYFSGLMSEDDSAGISVTIASPKHAGKGLGRLLLDLGMLTAKQTGQESLRMLDCNERSTRLIQRSGYNYRGTYDQEEGLWDFDIFLPTAKHPGVHRIR